MSINWYPGHMTKAFREMSEALKQVDMVIELRDARIVLASVNPQFEELFKQKPRLIILSKADLADKVETKKWLLLLKQEKQEVLALDFRHDDLKIIEIKCQELLQDKIARQIRKGIKPRAIRVMIVGIPNVGKSTLINRLVNKKTLKTADKPGVTRALSWVKLSGKLDLLDTPGVLWPKLDDENTAKLLAVTGAINDKTLDLTTIAAFAYDYLYHNYQTKLFARYDELPSSFQEAMLLIGQRRFFYKKEGEIDLERVVITFIDEIRSSLFQGVSWQKV